MARRFIAIAGIALAVASGVRLGLAQSAVDPPPAIAPPPPAEDGLPPVVEAGAGASNP
ncbi:MAG: hypothetical protein IRY99_10050, partial [Isosphaeraceae bacterium]|nr:hypothetical protein [Isosphaeraceae bacterium]